MAMAIARRRPSATIKGARVEWNAVPIPVSVEELRALGGEFAGQLRELKARVAVPDYGWYPYETLTGIGMLCEAVAPVWSEVRDAAARSGVADIGCGDGDFAALFGRLGCTVDAVDHAESNYNQLRGVERLAGELGIPVSVWDIDLDRPFQLPRKDYGLALFLGTLYHLKNPFYMLERLADHADWCVVSTRIAQVTPRGSRMEEEPLAYLLGAREANDDPTNFWIFSMTGLVRLMERAGWIVMAQKRVGCAEGSDPVHAAADERAFIVGKSRTRHPGMYVRMLDGWHAQEDGGYRWTARQFGLQVTLAEPAREFALRFFVPEPMAESGVVRVACRIGGVPAGAITCDRADEMEFRGRFPSKDITQTLEFLVESAYRPTGDARELGICIPIADGKLPFRVS
jgi:tRNA (mo5U34)-methyltransferase